MLDSQLLVTVLIGLLGGVAVGTQAPIAGHTFHIHCHFAAACQAVSQHDRAGPRPVDRDRIPVAERPLHPGMGLVGDPLPVREAAGPGRGQDHIEGAHPPPDPPAQPGEEAGVHGGAEVVRIEPGPDLVPGRCGGDHMGGGEAHHCLRRARWRPGDQDGTVTGREPPTGGVGEQSAEGMGGHLSRLDGWEAGDER